MKKIFVMIGIMMGLWMPRMAAQTYIGLTNPESKHALYLDIDRLYNFNRYEKSRIGAGLYYTVPFGEKGASPTFMTNWYVGYGFHDAGWKYGGDLAIKLHNRTKTKFLVGWQQDMEQAASRRIDSYRLLDVATNYSYLAWQFSAFNRLTVSCELTLPQSIMTIQGKASREHYLFDNHGPLYTVEGDARMPFNKFYELRLLWDIRGAWKFDLTLGMMQREWRNLVTPALAVDQNMPYARLLAQYQDTKPVGNYWNLNMFAQVGLTTKEVPYSRMFDIGGCGGSYYYFRNSLLTVLPGEFVSNNFAYINFRLIGKKPLWNTIISRPVPFVQIAGLWGCSWANKGGDADYSLLYNEYMGAVSNADAEKVIRLNQPIKGVFEPAIGISNLLRYQYINISFAVAYRVVPHSAGYYRPETIDNFSFMTGAAINL